MGYDMSTYIFRRLLQLIPVLIGVSFLVYFILDLAPGDAADVLATPEMSVADKEALRESLGLNRSVFVRYFDYITGFVRGDLGTSYITGNDVWQSYIKRFPATLILAFCTTLLAASLSIPIGVFSAKHRGTLADSAAMLIALCGLSMPGFFIGLILIIVFSLKLHLLDSGGFVNWKSLIMPSISAASAMLATMTRTTRTSMLDAMTMDYLDLARSKGVSEKKVINKHALKNALIPIVTIVGAEFAGSLGGTVITEKVFAWPGVGSFVIDAVSNRDIPVVCGCVTMTTMLITVAMLMVDILYAFIDPRIKEKYARKNRRRKKATQNG